MNRLRLEFAAEGFLAAMRREFKRMHPADPSPIRTLADYSPADRSALMKSLAAAIKLTEAENDNAFETWSGKRAAPSNSG